MKDLLRLYKYVLRYPARVLASIVFGVVVAGLGFVNLGAFLAIFEILFPKKDSPEHWSHLAESVPDWLGPLQPRLSGFFGEFVPEHRLGALMIVCGALVALAGLLATARFIQAYCSRYVGVHAGRLLSLDLHGRMLAQLGGFFTEARVSQTVSRFTNDINAVALGLSTLFGKVIREPLRFVAFLTFCLILNWRLTLINMVMLPLIALIVLRLGKRAKKATRKTLISAARLMGILSETFAGMRVVKVFLGERYEQERFGTEYKRFARQRMKVVRAEVLARSLVEWMAYAGLAAVVVVAGHFVIQDKLDAPKFFIFFAALGMMTDPVRKLANVNNRLQQLLAGSRRVFEYMDLPAEPGSKSGLPDLPGFDRDIRFEKVAFSYDGTHAVLQEVDFTVRKGQTVAVVGRSGVGKTTLLSLLCRFYEPTSGRITVDDTDIARVSVSSLRRHIGLVTQETILFDDTVARNIAYGRGEIDEDRLVSAARAAHAHEFITELTDGYETVIGEGGSMLSGGQRQRLAIARALYANPELLILDEATSSVDSESERLIREALAELMKGRTVFVIAHRLSTIERADRIIVLDDGRIQAIGTHTELLGTSPIYRDLYEESKLETPNSKVRGKRNSSE